MTRPLMSNRDHLEALITAADLLLDEIDNCSAERDVELKVRLTGAVERAKQDLYPQD